VAVAGFVPGYSDAVAADSHRPSLGPRGHPGRVWRAEASRVGRHQQARSYLGGENPSAANDVIARGVHHTDFRVFPPLRLGIKSGALH